LNNLGYLALIEGDAARAIALFGEAIARDGSLRAARHNLALAYAADRKPELARQALFEAGPPAEAEYNLGIISLAQGRRADAFAAFRQSCRTDRAQPHACERAAAINLHGINEGGTP
jgi:Flp pilus assembly protein TadD